MQCSDPGPFYQDQDRTLKKKPDPLETKSVSEKSVSVKKNSIKLYVQAKKRFNIGPVFNTRH